LLLGTVRGYVQSGLNTVDASYIRGLDTVVLLNTVGG